MLRFSTTCLVLTAFGLAACNDATPKPGGLDLPIEKFTLENGLDVVLHRDTSDPIVAINIAAHVGSARETEGRTGFAHLFEHLLFMDSENLGYGGLDAMNTRIGGDGTNGFTTHDMTQYFQAVPSDALEKVVWAEADKLGYFIKTVSQNVIDNEKQVVKNEKRQRVDNRPYGHSFYVVNKALYPTDHPYNWQVIGSLADLDAATLKDAQDFYARWYVPNNVTLTIAGDFDPAEAKAYVEKYFGEIPRGPDVAEFSPRPAVLPETKSLYYEDNFATVPQLWMVYPAVEQYHPDSYALDVLAEYLTEGKRAPFNEVLIDDTQVTSDVSAFLYAKEISGEFYLSVSANAGEDIDELTAPLAKAFEKFEADGIPQDALDRIKTKAEVAFYGEVESALGKAIQLSEYNLFTGDPSYYKKDLAGLQSVSTADVMRVYDTYIKDRARLYLSVVPKGETALKLDGENPAMPAEIVEEKIVAGEGAAVEFDPAARVIDTPTPSKFDRKIEPDFGAAYTLPTADIWQTKYDSGLEIYGLKSTETPLINFSLRLDAGRLRTTPDTVGVAGLTADMLEKGTANLTTAELEDAIGALGSTITISAGNTGTFVSGTTLARNFDATMALVKDMLFAPRWDAEEFATLKRKLGQDMTQSEGNPNAIARRELAKLTYTASSPLAHSGTTGYGTQAKLDAITLDDLKTFHRENYSVEGAKLRIVGDYDRNAVQAVWDDGALPHGKVRARLSPELNAVKIAEVYFYDVPGAKQSVVRMQRPALSATDPNYARAEAMNFPLGGIYTSKLMTELRLNKGYTYGIRSRFDGDKDTGTFGVSTSVRTNVTKESIALIREILSNYGPNFDDEDLALMKGALLRGQALKTETLSDKLGMLGEISAYGYAPDYLAQNAKAIDAMTLADFKALADTYLTPDQMQYLVVGDAATQAEGLAELGLGDVQKLGEK